MYKRRLLNRIRSVRGNSMVEFAPALTILLIFFFFPLLDMLTVLVSYGFCMVLNYNQVHEASLLQKSDTINPSGAVRKGIPDQWLSGMGHFVKVQGYPNTEVFYRNGETGPDKVTDRIVMVRTTVVGSPFLTIPLPVFNVPGLNGPMTFQISAERQMENPDYAP
ncbi:hypothetical protein BH11CYA1_BH11CYA1_24610 [soil metagenome]